VALQLLVKDGRLPDRFTDDLLDRDDEGLGRIRCPRCGWRPTASSRWSCIARGAPEPFFEACGTSWNTFTTRGRCPGCSHRWQWTSCLRCGEWSPHQDWYEPHDAA
jgi:DNA-directed RNA polymerase subunit RPC12/RpoP